MHLDAQPYDLDHNYVHNDQKITCILFKMSILHKQIHISSFKEWTPLLTSSTFLTRPKLLHTAQLNDIKLHIDQIYSEQVYNLCPPSEKTNLLFLSALQRQVESWSALLWLFCYTALLWPRQVAFYNRNLNSQSQGLPYLDKLCRIPVTRFSQTSPTARTLALTVCLALPNSELPGFLLLHFLL